MLAAAVPKLKLPLLKMRNGTLVPATGITVRASSPFAGVAVALIIEGVEIPLEDETYLNTYDSLHVDISTPGTLVLPAPPAAVPTKAELMRELADAVEALEGLDEGEDLDTVYDAQAEVDSLEARIAACSRRQ